MAKVRVKVLGGPVQLKDANTVGELARSVGASGYQALVNGEAASDSDILDDDTGETLVIFSQPTKAG